MHLLVVAIRDAHGIEYLGVVNIAAIISRPSSQWIKYHNGFGKNDVVDLSQGGIVACDSGRLANPGNKRPIYQRWHPESGNQVQSVEPRVPEFPQDRSSPWLIY